MIDIQFNMSEFQKAAQSMGAALDQVPFALSQAMNDAVKAARRTIVFETWPRSVSVRNRSFMNATMRMEFADKRNLRVSLFETLKRGHLAEHARGGSKQARGRLAIPGTIVKRSRGAQGVPGALRPQALPNAFRKGDAIYQRDAKHGGRLKLMYVLKPSATIRKDFPAYETFAEIMGREMRRLFPEKVRAAMKTRRG